ncbi:MAG: IS1634 family transposase, partial [Candidatus Dormibacteria bacterium]
LALLVIRVAEYRTQDYWHNLRHEIQRLHLVTLVTDHGTVAQRSLLTPGQQAILQRLDLPEPPRFYDFRPGHA